MRAITIERIRDDLFRGVVLDIDEEEEVAMVEDIIECNGAMDVLDIALSGPHLVEGVILYQDHLERAALMPVTIRSFGVHNVIDCVSDPEGLVRIYALAFINDVRQPVESISQSDVTETRVRFEDGMLDVTAPAHDVNVVIKSDGSVLWVNVDGKCVLRVCRIPELTLEDARPKT